MTNAYGNFTHQSLGYNLIGAGHPMEFGTVIPPNGHLAAYVSSVALPDGTDQAIVQRTVKTLGAALQQCRAGENDYIIVLPGHVEDVVDATFMDNLVAGCTIMGVGDPRKGNAPTFTFTTATTANWNIDDANVTIRGLKFDLTGFDAVVAGITVAANNVTIEDNYFVCSSSTAQAVDAIDIGDADNTVIKGNWAVGSGSPMDGSFIAMDEALADNTLIQGNIAIGQFAAAGGVVDISAAATNVAILDNIFVNATAASTATVAVADVASSGVIHGNISTVENNGTASAQGVVFAGTTTTTIKCGLNHTSDQAGASGLLAPTAAT